MEVIVTRAEREVDSKGAPVSINFDISVTDGEEHQAKTYWLTTAEIQNLAKVPLADIIKREAQKVIDLIPKKEEIKQDDKLTLETITEFQDATIDATTLEITSNIVIIQP